MADSEKLLSWARDEMNYRPRGKHYNAPLPTTEQLKIICTGQMKDIWTYVTTHVKSTQTIAKLKASHKLGRQSAWSSKDDDDNSGQKLKESMKKTQVAVTQLEQELARVHQDINMTRRKERVMQARVRDINLRMSIIRAHSLYVQEQVDIIAEYTRQIQNKIDNIANTSSSSEVYTTHGVKGGQLESNCSVLVRGACDRIGAYLQTVVFNKQTRLLDDSGREELWGRVEEPLVKYPVSELIAALTSYAQVTSSALQVKTNNINLREDSERLKFKYIKGSVEDTSQGDPLINSVHDMLQSAHSSNIKKFVETEKLKSAAWHITHNMLNTREDIHTNMRSKRQDNTEAMELAMKLLDVEKEVHAGKAALVVLQDYSSVLQERIKVALAHKEEVVAKYNTIQDFKKVVDSKQAMIRLLVKQNVDARSTLETKQSEIVAYEKQLELSHHETINSSVYQLVNSMPQELELFKDVSLSCFITLNSGRRCPVTDLSIYQLSGVAQFVCHDAVMKTCDSLEFPTYKAPDSLLAHVVALLEEAESLDDLLDGESAMLQFKDLRKHVETVDEENKDKMVSLLERKLTEAQQASQFLEEITQLCAHWRDQPAQDTTPWVRVDERTLNQWKDRWKVAATCVRHSGLSRSKAAH